MFADSCYQVIWQVILKLRFKIAIIAFFLSLAFSCVFAQNNLSFNDIPVDHWAAESVERLQNIGMLEGFPDGAYYGNLALSRYQMAVLLDRMLTLAKQEAQAEGLSIAEITTLQQQIDQLNAILSQSVQSLLAPNISPDTRRDTRRDAIQTVQNVVPDASLGASQNQPQASSRSALITPVISPSASQENFLQIQQDQLGASETGAVSQQSASQNQASVTTTSTTSNVRPEATLASFSTDSIDSTDAPILNSASREDATDIIARYEASPSTIAYQEYLDAYVAAYGNQNRTNNETSVNKIGVVPSVAGSGTSQVASKLLSQQTQVSQQIQAQQTQVSQQTQAQQPQAFAGFVDENITEQFAQQFAQQNQLNVQQPNQIATQAIERSSQEQSQQLSFQQPSSENAAQQVISPRDSFEASVQQSLAQQSAAQQNAAQDGTSQVVRSSGIYLQLGAFANALSAERLVEDIGALGFSPIQQEVSGLYKIFVGPYDFVTLEPASETLTAQGYSFFMVR